MKLKSKTNGFLTLLFACCVLVSAPLFGQVANRQLVQYIKKEKFGLEVFELAMCLPEIDSVLSSDTVYRATWKSRMSRVFDKRLSNSDVYFHSKEMKLFLKNLNQGTFRQKEFLLRSLPWVPKSTSNNASESFLQGISYPEDIDVACMRVLTCLDDDDLNTILKNNAVKSKFDEWIKYGFEEFRYYPSTRNPGRMELTSRLMRLIISLHGSSKNDVIQRSVAMLKSKGK